ncbi:MAG: hypothetical protein OJF47_003159 [Nitrospira sp.]|jgi:hypothetical protein|nr:MAG: hypothetical protein OJF47_003159 [Nitrospira sp.]
MAAEACADLKKSRGVRLISIGGNEADLERSGWNYAGRKEA